MIMRGTVLRDAIIIGVMCIGLAFAASNRHMIYEYFGILPPNAASNQQPDQTVETVDNVQPLKGLAVSIPKSRTDGQYWTEAKVNSGFIRFLVDTGASSVALTPEDARKAGIKLDKLDYNVPISTAGGENVAAYVTLKSISVGAVTVRNVKALVVPEGLSTSLLGMTYLGQLQKVEATPTSLILRL